MLHESRGREQLILVNSYAASVMYLLIAMTVTSRNYVLVVRTQWLLTYFKTPED